MHVEESEARSVLYFASLDPDVMCLEMAYHSHNLSCVDTWGKRKAYPNKSP